MKKNNFDLLRIFAAAQVFYYHTIGHLKIENSIEYFKYYPGVIIFFTISGFLIYQSMERNKNNLLKFLKNRLYRIYPGLIFSTIVLILVILISYKDNLQEILKPKFFLWCLGQLTIFQFWTPTLLRGWGVGAPNGSLWTIVVELQFYLFMILVFFKFNTYLKLLLLGLLSIAINMYFKVNDYGVFNKILGILILPYIYNFILGILFAKYSFLKKKLLDNKFVIWFIIYNILIIFKIRPSYYVDFKSLVANIILSILALSFAYSWTEKLEKLNPKLDISYGIYLFHMIYLNYFIHNFGIEQTKSKYLFIYL